MSFAQSFYSELLKSKRTSAWYICGLLAFFIPCILTIEYSTQGDINDKTWTNPWTILFRDGFMLFNLVILPLFTLLVTTLTPQVEYRNNAWKQVLASPQSYVNMWLSRYATISMLIALFAMTQMILLVITGLAISSVFPQYGFDNNPIDTPLLLISTGKSMVCILGISAAQFWLGVRSKNFIVPLTIGFLMWMISSTTTFDVNMTANLNPFTYPMYASFAKEGSSMIGVFTYSIVWCIVFLAIGYLDFVKRASR